MNRNDKKEYLNQLNDVKIEIHILHYKTCKLASETCTISVTKQFTAVIKISNYKHTELLEDTLQGGGMIMSSLSAIRTIGQTNPCPSSSCSTMKIDRWSVR